MSDWRELRSLAAANARRFPDLRIAREFLALFDHEDPTRVDTAMLLASIESLNVASLRETLMRVHVALPHGAFVAPPISPGDLVIDVHGRLDIIARPAPVPSAGWLAEQAFPPPRGDVSWWTAWPLNGGAVVLAEPQLFPLGRASLDRCWELVEHATVDQVRELVAIMPELATRLTDAR